VISGSDDDTLKIWDAETGMEVATLTGYSDSVTSVAVTSDGSRAVSGSADSTLAVWDLEKHAHICSFTTDAAVTSVAIADDTARPVIVCGDQAGRVHFLLAHGF
jgi:WD40 repeat protein